MDHLPGNACVLNSVTCSHTMVLYFNKKLEGYRLPKHNAMLFITDRARKIPPGMRDGNQKCKMI